MTDIFKKRDWDEFPSPGKKEKKVMEIKQSCKP